MSIKGKKAAIYARVSTDEQARQGLSIGDQVESLRKYASENGCILVGEYVDAGFSAHKRYKTRPSLMRLLADVECGKIELILFTKLDRWERRAADYYTIQEILDKNNVTWKAILEDYDTTTSDGRFKVGIMMSVNQHEAERTSERIRFTFEQKKKRGEICSPNPPKGYIYDGKTFIKDKSIEEGVNLFFKSLIEGNTISDSARTAYNFGFIAVYSTYRKMAENASLCYCGNIRGVKVEPYLTLDQARMIGTFPKRSHVRGCDKYLFSGIAFCKCGKRMFSLSRYYKGKRYKYYYCCTTPIKGKYCEFRKTITEENIESFLLDKIDEIVNHAMIKINYEEQNKEDIKEKLKRRISDFSSKKKRLIDAYAAGILTLDEIGEKKEELEKQISEAENELYNLGSRKNPQANFPPYWKDIYRKLSYDGKCELWHRTIERIEVTNGVITDVKMRF